MSSIWWVVGLIVGMRAGRRLSRLGEDDGWSSRRESRMESSSDRAWGDNGLADDLDEYDRISRERHEHPERFRHHPTVIPEPDSGITPERLAELLDGDRLPTPEERRFIRDWLDAVEDESTE